MKFSLFAHMERIGPELSHEALYREFIELCEMADKGGMHAIWTGEHHCMDFTISPNPFINIADLARRTKNVRLGTGNVVAPFWHPLRLAGEAAMTDIIADGRLDLGIARGAYSFEYDRMAHGMDAMTAGSHLREMVEVLPKIWAGDFAYEGKHWSFPKSTSAPKPLQNGGPPIWIAARDPNTHDFAVAQGCNVQVTPLHLGDPEVGVLIGRFNDACKAHPEVKRPKVMLLMHGFVGADANDCLIAANDLRRFYCYFAAWFKNERPINQAIIQPLSEEEMTAMPQYAADKMLENTVTGTPDQVIKRLKAYEAMGYDEFSLWIDSFMTTERKQASLKRFIDHVMPAFR
jgi:alkanesulfonate monooxygenase SsuD/methylene tetrahydromethanopterin reductase-like flavin-dependent oxidoreductase (luciferase family)